jgi:cell shape-determining protein MreC
MTFNVKVALINQKQNYKTKNNLLKNEHKHPKRIINQRITYRKTNNTSKTTFNVYKWQISEMVASAVTGSVVTNTTVQQLIS